MVCGQLLRYERLIVNSTAIAQAGTEAMTISLRLAVPSALAPSWLCFASGGFSIQRACLVNTREGHRC